MTHSPSIGRTKASVQAPAREKMATLLSSREWLIPLGIFLISRVVTTSYLLIGASHQAAIDDNPVYHSFVATPASPSYWTVATNWDGQWYQDIAEQGYPTHIAIDQPTKTPYAFYPFYPMLCRLTMLVTQLPFNVVAPLISTSAGAIAILLLYRLFRRRSGVFVASAAIFALCVFVTSPVLQVAYTESLALLLLVSAMTLLADHRYGAFVAIIVMLALTRPVALPMLVVVAAHFWRRWRVGEVGVGGPVSRSQILLVCGATGASAGLWPALAGWLSGVPNVYLKTMKGWVANDIHPGGQLNPANFGVGAASFIWGVLIVWILILRRRTDTGWSMDLRVWSGAYVGYLTVTVGLGPSLLRYAMLVLVPMWPFAEDPDPSEGRADRIARRCTLCLIGLVGLASQYAWVTHVFTVPVNPAKQPYP